MTKTILLAAAITILPTVASAAERSFTRDGVTYTYTSERKGEHTVLTGTTSAGSKYRLTVRGKRVAGIVAGTPVAFVIAKPLADTVETASLD